MDVLPTLQKLSAFFQAEELNLSVLKPVISASLACLKALRSASGCQFQEFLCDMNEHPQEDCKKGVRLYYKGVEMTNCSQEDVQAFGQLKEAYLGTLCKSLQDRLPEDIVELVNAFVVLFSPQCYVQALDDDIMSYGATELNLLLDQYGGLVSQERARTDFPLFKRVVVGLGHLSLQELCAQLVFIDSEMRELFPDFATLASLASVLPVQPATCEKVFRAKDQTKKLLTEEGSSNVVKIAVDGPTISEFDFEAAIEHYETIKDKQNVVSAHESCVLLERNQLPAGALIPSRGLVRAQQRKDDKAVYSSPAQSSPLLASLSVPGRPLQPQLDLKHFLPFRLNSSSPLSLFPNFNTALEEDGPRSASELLLLPILKRVRLMSTQPGSRHREWQMKERRMPPVTRADFRQQMDPVQKAVINHTFGVPQPLKKKQIISCNICHLRFNSTNQAEAHYKGHKHTRKLKAIEAQKNKQRSSGAAASAGRERERDREKIRVPETLPALMERSLMDATNQKTLVTQCGLSPALSMDPESGKGKETPGVSVVLTPVSEVSSLELVALAAASPQVSPASQLSERVSEAGAPDPPVPVLESSSQEPPQSEAEPRGEGDKDPKKSKPHLHCPICKVTVNSTSQLEAHNSGAKHKLMLEGQSAQPRRRSKVLLSRAACKTKRLGNKGSVGVQSKAFHCEVCEIYVNSETQLKQHMNSRRHKDRLAGKPPKPKFTPYNKTQQNSILAGHRMASRATVKRRNVRWTGYAGGAVSAMKKVFGRCNLTSLSTQTKLALQKQLTKTLTTGFLPSPLSPAALCTVAANPLALRHPAGTATLIQTPLLGPALFRPAPGPLRATHTPIVFTPY
ncbi:Z385D protein, partial [Atractosteus spatula]|nr:Z385D protein [Atractosteus spatula]